MEKNQKHKVFKKRKEFRYHPTNCKGKDGKMVVISHPTYIFLEEGNLYVFVTITHSNKVNDSFVIKLRKNPNPKDERDSYWVAEIRKDEIKNFGKKHNSWNIDELDDKAIREFFEIKKDDSAIG